MARPKNKVPGAGVAAPTNCTGNRVYGITLLVAILGIIWAAIRSGLAPTNTTRRLDRPTQPAAHTRSPKRSSSVTDKRQFIAAVSAGNAAMVDQLLQRGASPDATKANGWPVLITAAQDGHTSVVSALLKHGAAVDMAKDDWTALMLAAGGGHKGVVRALLEHGASTSMRSAQGATPLHLAAEFDHAQIVELLLATGGAFVNAKRPADGNTALHRAAETGHEQVATVLLRHGATVNIVATYGYTPLCLAVRASQVDVAISLLEHGASPNIPREDGSSPLHLAAQFSPPVPRLVSALLKHRAHVNAATISGQTALHHAINVRDLSIVRILLQARSQVDAGTSDYHFTPLRMASELGDASIVAALLWYGASLDATDRFNRSAPYVAAYFEHAAVSQLLDAHSWTSSRTPSGTQSSNKLSSNEPSGLPPIDYVAAAQSTATGSMLSSPAEELSSTDAGARRRLQKRQPTTGVKLADLSVIASVGRQQSVADEAQQARALAHAATVWRMHGVVVFPGLLSRQVMRDLRERVERERKAALRDTVDRSHSIRQARLRTLRALDVEATSSPAVRDVAAALAPFLRGVFGSEQMLLESSFMHTDVGAADQSFHPDVLQYDQRLASVQISLVDTHENQGALEVVPGTQHQPMQYLEHDPSRRVIIAVPEGTVTFYSPTLVHRGRANTHDRARLFVGLTLLGSAGVVPSGIPYTLLSHDLGRWWLKSGALLKIDDAGNDDR